jgi:AAA15 family ATPase/GTPase
MIDFINLTNYRNISEKKHFEIRPLTILIGPNNSGKSSLIKALLLLSSNKRYLDVLRFQDGIHKLGDFNSILSNQTSEKYIEFELPIRCGWASSIKLKYIGQNTEINNGIISSIEILSVSGPILKMWDLEYKNESYNIIGFKYQINFLHFHEYFHYLKEEENANKDHRSDKRIFIDDKPKFNPDTPIFEFEINDTTKIPDLDLTYLSEVLSSECFGVYSDNDEYSPNLHLLLFMQINFTSKGKFSGYYSVLKKFKENGLIDKIKTTNNGSLFFKQVQSSFEEAFHLIESGSMLNFKYISSNLTRQERLHTTKNDAFRNLLTDTLQGSDVSKSKFINTWMQRFGLLEDCEKVQIKRIAQTGYEILIINENTKHEKNIADCGYGLSQIITLLLEFNHNYNFCKFLVEEPEANLHPELQSKLADLFASLLYNNSFIIETHSEYMVRKFQYLVAKGELKSSDIIIHYFWKENENSHCKQIEIQPNGVLSDSFENGFYDESINLKFELLKLIKAQSN